MISMQIPFLFLSYIWLSVLVCLATCNNYDLSNGVNPFDTNFFKVKRKHHLHPRGFNSDHSRAFISNLFQGPITNSNSNNRNSTRGQAYADVVANPLAEPLNRFDHNNRNSHLTTSSSMTTSSSQSLASLSINNLDNNDPAATSDIITKVAELFRNNFDRDQLNQLLLSNILNAEQLEEINRLIAEFENSQSLECKVKSLKYEAVNTDEQGRQCRRHMTANGCFGRCDTGEFPDWRFPFKKSFHHVCIHKAMRIRMFRFKAHECEPGYDLNSPLVIHRYIEALSCACQSCQSSEVSCEGMGHLATSAPFR